MQALVAAGALTAGLAAGAAPAHAAIVYVCTSGAAANLCQVNSDGSDATQLTSNGSYASVSLDPAGTRMVFDRGSALYGADGSAQNAVGPISNASSLAKIGPDGTTGVDDEDFSDNSEGLLVCTFPTGGGSITECGFQALYPTFTPSAEIVASFLDGTSHQFVVSEYPVGTPTSGGAPPVLASDATAGSLIESAVSPDGQTLAVVIAPNSSSAGGYIALYSMSTGQFIRQLTNGTSDENPAWSPDGTQLVFARGNSLYTTAVTASPGAETLLVSNGTDPTWGGPETPPATPPTTPPTTPPAPARPTHSKITKAKIDAHRHTASFSFSARGASRFQCELVPSPKKGHKKPRVTFGSCRSPKTYKHLKAGKYTFLVRGVDSAGGDRTPARKTFAID